MNTEQRAKALISGRDAIASELKYCKQAQSWNPKATRTKWYSELVELVEAIDDAATSASEDEGLEEEYHEEICIAADEAEWRAVDLAEDVAEAQADALVNEIEQADDEELEAILARGQSSDGRQGAYAERQENGVIKVTGWAMPRVVLHKSGVILGSTDGVVEHEVDMDTHDAEEGLIDIPTTDANPI